jgi:hypothetical protein
LSQRKQENKKDMAVAKNIPFANFRDAILEMYEIGESINVFGYAHRLCISLRLETITMDQYDGLCKELKAHCHREEIKTSNEVVSLF